MRCVAVYFSVIFVLLGLTVPAAAEKRVALVIGNGAYKNATRLVNPANDASDVSAALRRVGFETIVGIDLDKAGMEDAAIRFARAAREADVAIFYYSGHAMQFGGVNYLMPVDARLTDEADLRRMARVDDIVADIQQAKNLRILVLDSCRDNPLADELRRSISRTRASSVQRGLAKIDSPQGMVVAYATQAGRTAEDGDGRNSPYTTAFLKNIEAPEEIGTVFRRISADVYAATKREQLPELSLSLIGEFYLKGRPGPSAAPTANIPAVVQDPAERTWAVVQNTSSVAVLETFIKQYGNTFFGELARARLDELRKSQVANVAPQVASPPTAVQPSLGAVSIPRIAQRVVLYEEILEDPKGNRVAGTAIWRTEMRPATAKTPAELVVRCDVELPERKINVTLAFRRNIDASLPASHTVEIVFTMPPDAQGGGVQKVPGLLMKQAEQTRGVPLAGLAVPVTPGYFLIGLSKKTSDVERNVQLLKERSWFDIPIIYNNDRRAILALEKGLPGEQAFKQAFAAWKQ